ncbi:MAG: hypothetical protein AB1352_01495 [Patescibacteria group bacterium]
MYKIILASSTVVIFLITLLSTVTPAHASCYIDNNVSDDGTYICTSNYISRKRINAQTFSSAHSRIRVRQNTGFNTAIAGEDMSNVVVMSGNASSTVVTSFSVGNITINYSVSGGIFPE